MKLRAWLKYKFKQKFTIVKNITYTLPIQEIKHNEDVDIEAPHQGR